MREGIRSHRDATGLRLGQYIRVSQMGDRKREDESFHAEAFQDEDVAGWAERNGHTIVWTAAELNLSGAKWDKRKSFVAMLEQIRAGELDGIAVAYLSRFARTARIAYKAIDYIYEAGGYFVSVGDQIDLSTDEGWNQFNFKMTMAEAEWRMKRAGLMRVQQDRIEKGIPMRTCFGYQRGPDRRLVPQPEQAPWVQQIFQWRVEEVGWKEIAHRLNTTPGVPAPSAKGKRWTDQTIKDLVKRRTYLGEVWHDKERKHVTTGAHEPLVDEMTFELANRARAKRFDRHRHHLLAGLLRCAGCRYKLKATTSMPRGGKEYVNYVCREHSSGACPAPVRVTELQLLPLVVREWVRLSNLPGRRFQQVGEDSEVQRVRSELDVLEHRYKTWANDDELRSDDPDLWREGRRERKAAVDAKREELSLKMRAADKSNAPAEAEAMPENREEMRELLLGTFEVVFVRAGEEPLQDRVRAFVKGEQLPALPVPGQLWTPEPFVFGESDPARAGEAGF